MASTAGMPPKRPRISAAKSRTGCITCKNRRVKCDEQRPECDRCISSGRICFGYATGPKRPAEPEAASSGRSANATFEPITRQLFDSCGTPEERRALDFFFSRTAPQLSGYFDATFWSRLVLQFGKCEPAVRHALMAVSSAHEQAEVAARGLEVSDGSRGRFTLKQYNKAIARLSEQAHGGPQPSRTLLLTCVLFVCLEFLRGDTHMAMTHTLNGLNILNSWQADVAKQKQRGYSDYQRKEEDFVNENLTPIFCRLSVISTLLGKPTPIVHSRSPSMDGSESPSLVAASSFKTLNEARNALIDIQNSSLRFMWATMEKKYKGTIAMTEILEQVRLEMRLAEWYRALEELERQYEKRPQGQTSAQARQAEEDGLIILRLLYYVAHIWLSSCLSLKESTFDAFLSEFQQINTLSTRLLSRRRSAPSTSPHPSSSSTAIAASSGPGSGGLGDTFSFDTEVVGPLYFTAIKCREPTTRRQTLALLEQCNKREGAIDSRRASQLATAIMQIEEAGLQLATKVSSTASNPNNPSPQHPPPPPLSSSTTTTKTTTTTTASTTAPAPQTSARLDTAAMFTTTPLPSSRTRRRRPQQTPQTTHQYPPESTRIAHVVGLPTTFTDAADAAAAAAAMPPSASPHAALADTAARLPAEGNRIMAYYEPVGPQHRARAATQPAQAAGSGTMDQGVFGTGGAFLGPRSVGRGAGGAGSVGAGAGVYGVCDSGGGGGGSGGPQGVVGMAHAQGQAQSQGQGEGEWWMDQQQYRGHLYR